MVKKEELRAAVFAALPRDRAEGERVWAYIERSLWGERPAITKRRDPKLQEIMEEIRENSKGVL